jgi:hypothetical protein
MVCYYIPMATTTEQYVLHITINEGVQTSPFTLGKAISAALSTMPDDTTDWSFDPNHGDHEQITLPLSHQWLGEEPVEVGTLTMYPVDTEEERERVATMLTMGLDED